MRTLAIITVVLLAGCQTSNMTPADRAQADAAAWAAIAGMYSMGSSLQSAPRPVTCHNAGYTVTCF